MSRSYATNPSMDALPANRTWQPSRSHGTYQHKAITSRSRQLLMMGTWLPETCWATIRREIKNTKKRHLVGFSYPHWHYKCVCSLSYAAGKMSMRLFMFSYVSCPDIPCFPTLSHKQHEFKEKVIECKMCFEFLGNFFWNISHPKKNSARFYHKRTQDCMKCRFLVRI